MCGESGATKKQAKAAANLYKTQEAISREQWDLYKQTYLPAEQSLVSEAMAAGSPAEFDRAVGTATTDVTQAFDKTRAMTRRNMGRYGINPASGNWAGMERDMGISQAASEVGARNNARQYTDQSAWNKKAGVVGMGRGIPGQTSAGIGSAAGGMAGMANASANADAQETAGLFGAIGTGIGAFAALSSKDYKERKRGISEEGVLDEVKDMPVESWKYKRGIADEGEHVGPYAEDFQEAFGVGDGKTINMVDAFGINLAATKALAKKLDRIEQRMGISEGRA